MTTAWEREVEAVTALVRRRTGLTESGGRDVGTAMRRRMHVERRADAASYASLLASDPAVFDALIHELTVGETYFMREPEQLAYLRAHVLPSLAADRAAADAMLRVWSAGCATGEEVYTLAMLLHDTGLHGRARVLGTDIAEQRLRRARHGVYGAWSFRGTPEALRRRWFRPLRESWRVIDELRSAVDFRILNLQDEDWSHAGIGSGSMDLVLCRNVLIYLDAPSARAVAQRLIDALVPGGWLLLGASDPWLAGLESCEAFATGAGVIYRKSHPSARARVPLLRPWSAPPAPETAAHAARSVPRDHAAAPERPPNTGKVPGHAAWGESRAAEKSSPAAETRDSVADVRDDVAGTREAVADVRDAIARVRMLADRGDLSAAGRACSEQLERHPASAELRVLQALLLVEAGHLQAAADAARAALYLDPALIPAHLTLGSARARLGHASDALAAFRTAERLLRGHAADAPVPGAGGALTGELIELARTQIHLLEARR